MHINLFWDWIVKSLKGWLTQINEKKKLVPELAVNARSTMLLCKALIEQSFPLFHWHLFSFPKSNREKNIFLWEKCLHNDLVVILDEDNKLQIYNYKSQQIIMRVIHSQISLKGLDYKRKSEFKIKLWLKLWEFLNILKNISRDWDFCMPILTAALLTIAKRWKTTIVHCQIDK